MEKFFDNKFFTGINYWDSAHATRMWQEFDETVIDADMQVLRSAGVNSLRIFPLWEDFQPVKIIAECGNFFRELGFADGSALPWD